MRRMIHLDLLATLWNDCWFVAPSLKIARSVRFVQQDGLSCLIKPTLYIIRLASCILPYVLLCLPMPGDFFFFFLARGWLECSKIGRETLWLMMLNVGWYRLREWYAVFRSRWLSQWDGFLDQVWVHNTPNPAVRSSSSYEEIQASQWAGFARISSPIQGLTEVVPEIDTQLGSRRITLDDGIVFVVENRSLRVVVASLQERGLMDFFRSTAIGQNGLAMGDI